MALTTRWTPVKRLVFLLFTVVENCRIMERKLEFTVRKTNGKPRILQSENARECTQNAAFCNVNVKWVNATFFPWSLQNNQMKTLSINIVLWLVCGALIGIWHPSTQATTCGKPAQSHNPFPNFLYRLWKTYVPRKKELYNSIANLVNDFAYGGLSNCKKVCNPSASRYKVTASR